jgi:IS5 family transposase
MKQTTFASTGFELVTKRTRKREFLEEMNLVVPWTELTGLIQPFAPASKTGRPPFPIATMLCIHFSTIQKSRAFAKELIMTGKE